jgi:hypothetical protein
MTLDVRFVRAVAGVRFILPTIHFAGCRPG